MKILLASSEVHPYSKTGGLADMAGALAKALAHAGHQVGVVTPLYRGIRERFPALTKMDWHMDLPLGSQRVQAEVWKLEPEKRLTLYFVHQSEFYQRPGVYQENGVDYPDNAARFIFFSKAALHLARYLPWKPEVIHANDWQTGMLPLLLLQQRMQEGWSNIPRTCFTIHNLAYQGIFPAPQYGLTNLPLDYFNPMGAEFYTSMNCLKAGIVYADAITTVSPRYAREITTPELGCGLDDVLRRRQGSLFGILNGVDYEEWSTTGNPHLPHPYSVRSLAGKAKDKLALQKELGLPAAASTPLFGTITRLADQKGLDIQLAALEEMLSTDLQFVLLGSGAPVFENAYRALAKRYPDKVAVRIGFDQGLSQRIEAGCDFYLMPSRFEPCGLNQMYSLRYGTIPIVRITGGLDDTVVDATEDHEQATGIKFAEYSGRALARAMRKALVLYGDPKVLLHYRRNGMMADFSWDRMVKRYLDVYRG
ncbi:MAG: glycogen/starch synthase, ADP-glucose type [Pedosphaera sp.]|nr:glycogen/starch synthase, ADP-glucose type [Pedosphaera sp.]